ALLGAIVVPNVLSSSGNSTFSDSSGGPLAAEDGPSDLTMDAYAATRSRTTYDADALDDQVTKLVAARRTLSPSPVPTAQGTATTSPSTQDESSDPNGALTAALATDPAAAQACLEGYIPDVVGVPPLAIDIGKWEGEPAAIIVMPNPDPTLVDVWVIDPDCSIPDEPLIYFATVAR
ncbi:MAG: hypothetical protein LH630_00695, partial [Actinomycetia bacterium]|nr:hypothetical protein [Actinomycetes bacterium]